MVIGSPRSGTTWAANWLTTDTTICLHDPLANSHYSEWDAIQSKKTLGISDTGISLFHEWLNRHPARKVILHRENTEIAASLGIPEFLHATHCLDKVNGMHVHWRDMFDNPQPIYELLLQKPFDQERHTELKNINMQPHGDNITINHAAVKRIMNEIKELSNA